MKAMAMSIDSSFTSFHSPRLRLTPIGAADAAGMYPGLQSPRLYDYIPDAPPSSIDALAQRYARLARGRSPDGGELWYNWVVREALDDRPLGFVQATIGIDESSPCLLAYVIFEPAWGRGIGREAVSALIAHLRDTLGRIEFKALIDTRNARSIGLVESLQFRRVATHVAADYVKGEQSDEYEYRLPPEERGPT
jgi:RimJ/RimL family protein N-acetyltransferase